MTRLHMRRVRRTPASQGARRGSAPTAADRIQGGAGPLRVITHQHRRVPFPRYEDVNGVLSVYEGGRHVPFDIQRVFTVNASRAQVRGHHAHKQCAQLLVCLLGRVRVLCDDGTTVTQYLLDAGGEGVYVGPGVWAWQEYLADATVLMAFCDQPYDAEDYIRDYDEFKRFIARG